MLSVWPDSATLLSLFSFMNATSRSSICAASGLIVLLSKSNNTSSRIIVRSTFGAGGGGGAGFGGGGGGGGGGFASCCNQISKTAAKQGADHQTDSCPSSFVSVAALNSVMRCQYSTYSPTCSAGSSADQCSLGFSHPSTTVKDERPATTTTRSQLFFPLIIPPLGNAITSAEYLLLFGTHRSRR